MFKFCQVKTSFYKYISRRTILAQLGLTHVLAAEQQFSQDIVLKW